MAQLQSRYIVTARAGGRDLGTFQTFSGGNVKAESVLDRGPTDEFPDASGGEKTIDPITISRNKKLTRDTAELRRFLRGLVGSDNALVVNYRELDQNRNPYGPGDTYTATITDVNPGESDNNQPSQHSVLTIVAQPSKVS